MSIGTLGVADIEHAERDECAALIGHIRQARGWLDAIEARITSRMTKLYETEGAEPAADMHSRCGGVSAAEGRRKERRSKTLDEAPSFGDALAEGRIGAEHVDALANTTSKLDDDVRDELLDHTDDLLTDAESMSPEQFARSCRDLARQLERDHGLERNRRQRRDTFLSRKPNVTTGMVEGRFAFHPELANQIFGAVDKEVAAMVSAGERRGDPEFCDRSVDRNRLAAEALGNLVAGGHQQRRPHEADVTLIIDEHSLTSGELHEHSVCETSDGLPLPPASVRRLLCNGIVTPVIVDADGNALDAGRTIRSANRRQRRALRAMYRCCAFGDCDIDFHRCEIHHIIPWELGGPTDLANLVPACSRHHHALHEGGWQLELLDDRTLIVRRSDGSEISRSRPDVPAGRRADRHRRRPAA